MSRSLPPSLEGETNITPWAPVIEMMSCEQAVEYGFVPDDSDYCFNGSQKDRDYDALIQLWNTRNEILVVL